MERIEMMDIMDIMEMVEDIIEAPVFGDELEALNEKFGV